MCEVPITIKKFLKSIVSYIHIYEYASQNEELNITLCMSKQKIVNIKINHFYCTGINILQILVNRLAGTIKALSSASIVLSVLY